MDLNFSSRRRPVTIRFSEKEIKLLKKMTGLKTTTGAVHKLIQDELERQNQIELGRKIYGKMKPSDFNARLI